MYGSGPDKDAAVAKALKLGLDMPFRGPVDHAELAWSHKVNRSLIFYPIFSSFLQYEHLLKFLLLCGRTDFYQPVNVGGIVYDVC